MTPGRDSPLATGRTGYDPTTGTYHVQHDWDGDSPLWYTVLLAVSALSGAEPHAVGPLTDAVDPDALDQLFVGRQQGNQPTDGVRFTLERCDVVVRRDGHVVVHPPDPV